MVAAEAGRAAGLVSSQQLVTQRPTMGQRHTPGPARSSLWQGCSPRHTWKALDSFSRGLARAARMAVVVVPMLEPSVRG